MFRVTQAAEKALKALLEYHGVERRGHVLLFLARVAEEHGARIPGDIRECLAFLDKQYIPTRHPDVYTEGAPGDFYTEREARECIACAEKVARWVGETLREVLESEA